MSEFIKDYFKRLREHNRKAFPNEEDFEKGKIPLEVLRNAMLWMEQEYLTKIDELAQQVEPLKEAVRELEEFKKRVQDKESEEYMNSHNDHGR